MDVLRVFDSHARTVPTKDCLRFNGQSLSYSYVYEQSRRAAALFTQLGIQRGDKIAAMCFNTPGFVYALLGAWRLGAVIVPINHKLQTPEVDYILRHSEVKVCIFDGVLAPVVSKLDYDVTLLSTDTEVAGIRHFETELQATEGIDGVERDEQDLAEILYTSGTTGSPKGCLHTHRNVVLAAITGALGLSMTPDERLLMVVPIWHASPLNNWFIGTLYLGGTTVLLREYAPLAFLQTAQDERITFCFGPPVIYTTPLHVVDNIEDFDLSSVRVWIYGGGPIGADVARRLNASYKSDNFYQVYGMTETGPIGTALLPNEQLAHAGSIGRTAMAGAELRLVRDDGHEAKAGEIGEIWLRTEATMLGYLNDPEATAAAFTDKWYRTGDLARVDEEGYLFIVDRSKDMIITGGENVYSKEVEDAISSHAEVADVAVIGRPHPEWGETVVAHVVVVKDSPVTASDLSGYLSDRLAKYKIPREFNFTDSLPRTPTGKIQKHLIRSTAG